MVFFGMSILSADARSVTDASNAAVSLYEPENGPVLNVFAGVHLAQYFSVQANWIWNRNDVTLREDMSHVCTRSCRIDLLVERDSRARFLFDRVQVIDCVR
jgi:hypothetical protein